jgi:hypothetical protein
MGDQKPGCIHPDDPQGCIGTFMVMVVLAVIGVLVRRKQNPDG